VAAAAFAVAGCTAGGVAPQTAAARNLPPGEGRVVLERECLKCHELDAIELFSGFYNRDRWRSLVLTMRANGANVDDAEVEVLAAYLARYYGTGG